MASTPDSDDAAAQSGGLAEVASETIAAAGSAGEIGLIFLAVGVLIGGIAAIANFALRIRQL